MKGCSEFLLLIVMTMYLYQRKRRYFAQIASGLEEMAADELARLGAENVSAGFRGAYFESDPATLYRVNYMARLVSRVLAPLISFSCHSRQDLYRCARLIDWPDFFSIDHTFAVFANVSNSQINHSQFAALCVKDAIVDTFRDHYGKRPSIDSKSPDIWINLHLMNNRGIISIDTSGGPLHRRGYRTHGVKAPMQETLAAAIIELTQWRGDRLLYDPMCGSGTLLCEALIKYCQLPAGIIRSRFGFEFLPDFNPDIWEETRKNVRQMQRQLPQGIIGGSDNDRAAVTVARKNCCHLPNGNQINIIKKDFFRIDNLEKGIIVCNPPYGIRLNAEKDLAEFYKGLGNFLKQRCNGAEAYVYFGEREWLKAIGLKPSWKKALRNGGLDGRLAKFEIY